MGSFIIIDVSEKGKQKQIMKKIEKGEKNIKKGVDRELGMCYYNRALERREEARRESGRTLKTIQRERGRTTVNSEMSFNLEGWGKPEHQIED